MKRYEILLVPPKAEPVKTVLEADLLLHDLEDVRAFEVVQPSDAADFGFDGRPYAHYNQNFKLIAQIHIGVGTSCIIEMLD